MSETTKTTGVQDEAEKEIPETEEPVTEPVEESPEAIRKEKKKRKPQKKKNQKERHLSLAKRKKIINWNSRSKI